MTFENVTDVCSKYIISGCTSIDDVYKCIKDYIIINGGINNYCKTDILTELENIIIKFDYVYEYDEIIDRNNRLESVKDYINNSINYYNEAYSLDTKIIQLQNSLYSANIDDVENIRSEIDYLFIIKKNISNYVY